MMKEISITDIAGIKVGHAQDFAGGTGCTAVIAPEGAVAGVDVRGGGPASRETELLRPEKLVQQIHCVMLSGGSAFGLAAGDGAMQFLREKGIGFDTGFGLVPIVCGASLFDLVYGDPEAGPDSEMGYRACEDAFSGKPEGASGREPGKAGGNHLAIGSVGAGTGCTVGKLRGLDYMMKSGLGIYAVQVGEVQVGAVVAVNALGDILDHKTGEIIAGMRTEDGKGFADTQAVICSDLQNSGHVFKDESVQNTTIGCIITNARLDKAQATKFAQVAGNGYVQAIRPVHTSADGDTVFALATGEVDANPDALGALAQEVMAEAICRGVRAAQE